MASIIGKLALALLFIPAMFFMLLGVQVVFEKVGVDWEIVGILFITYLTILAACTGHTIDQINK